jgi:hypothetical protein
MDSFTIETDTNATPTQPSTAGEAARQELSRIYTDPTHHLHAAYKLNPQDERVSTYVHGLYAKTYGGGPSGAATPPAVSVQAAPDWTKSSDQLDAESASALTPDDHRAFEALRQDWGEHYEVRLREAQNGTSRLTGHLGAAVDDLSAACLDAGLDFRTITKIMSHYEQRMRAFEQGS